MTQSLRSSSVKKTQKLSKVLVFERVMAVTAILNLVVVFFDFTYLTWRDFYLDFLPKITQIYDPIKGIEPHRETQFYLETVNQLESQIIKTGLDSPEVGNLLKKLQDLSVEMINENPFASANKTGTLERIKKRMIERLPNPEKSSKKAFIQFWSREYFQQNNWKKESTWFDQKIGSLIATNYYRAIGLNGLLIDHFWYIDLIFISIFWVEFLGRTWIISRRHIGVSWGVAMIWRWYDWFLLIPFWRWLRPLSVIVRIDQAKMPDLEWFRREMSRVFVAGIAPELTEVIVLQILNQIQVNIQQGDWFKQILSNQQKRYYDLNGVNEIEEIATRLVQVTVYKVLPQLQPDIEALLQHSMTVLIQESSVYKGLEQLPGFSELSQQFTQKIIETLSQFSYEGPQTAYETVKKAMEDPVGTQLSSQLVQHFGQILGQELQQKQTLPEIQRLIYDFLEEVKINYVQQMSQEDLEKILAQGKKLRSLRD